MARKAFRFGIVLTGADESAARLRRIPRKVDKHLPTATRQIAESVQYHARSIVGGAGSATTLGRRTGGFFNSIKIRHLAHAKETVGSDHPAARIHEHGGKTSPHVIRPRRAKVLAFKGRDGSMVFATIVHHPGSKIPPRPWLEPAVRRTSLEVGDVFLRSLRAGLLEAGLTPRGRLK